MIKKISETISALFTEEGFTSGNCILVEDDIRLMVDSACGRVLAQVSPDTVDILLNSHHHVDHIGGNDFFPRALIMAHPLEKESMTHPERLSATEFWDELMDSPNILHQPEIAGQRNRFFDPWPIHEDLYHGRVVNCGKTSVRVIHTPGHTAGHCSFHFLEDNVIFAADICLSRVGPWYGGIDSDIDQFIDTIDLIIDMKPEVLVTGHLNSPVRGKEIPARLRAYRDKILKRDQRILELLRERPQTVHELAEHFIIYPDHPSSFVEYWEKSNIMIHCRRLVGQGEISVNDSCYYAS